MKFVSTNISTTLFAKSFVLRLKIKIKMYTYI